MLAIGLTAMALLGLACLYVIRLAVRAESGADTAVLGDRPPKTYSRPPHAAPTAAAHHPAEATAMTASRTTPPKSAPAKAAPAKFEARDVGSDPRGAPAAARGKTMTLRIGDAKCACEFARRIAGKTFEPELAPKLPLAGCGRVDCTCRYEQVTERRRKSRRESTERRDMIRFETKGDRREKSDRRKSNTRWSGPR